MRTRHMLFASLAILTALSVCAADVPAAGKASASGKANKTRISKRRAKRVRGQKAPTSERIAEIQQALAKDGRYTGTPNGKWDGSTVEALRRFQAAHSLNPTGRLDAPTLQKLGLGSETAGLAAPLPPGGTAATSPQSTPQQP